MFSVCVCLYSIAALKLANNGDVLTVECDNHLPGGNMEPQIQVSENIR